MSLAPSLGSAQALGRRVELLVLAHLLLCELVKQVQIPIHLFKKMLPFIYLDQCNLPLSHRFSEMAGNFILCISSNPCQDHANVQGDVLYSTKALGGHLLVMTAHCPAHPVPAPVPATMGILPGQGARLPIGITQPFLHSSLPRLAPEDRTYQPLTLSPFERPHPLSHLLFPFPMEHLE